MERLRRLFSAHVFDYSDAMDDWDHAAFKSHLYHANRAIMLLDPIAARDGSEVVEFALRDARKVYVNLVHYLSDGSLPKDTATRLQAVTDRLRARLRFFGESV